MFLSLYRIKASQVNNLKLLFINLVKVAYDYCDDDFLYMFNTMKLKEIMYTLFGHCLVANAMRLDLEHAFLFNSTKYGEV